jgi:hypothetical protein
MEWPTLKAGLTLFAILVLLGQPGAAVVASDLMAEERKTNFLLCMTDDQSNWQSGVTRSLCGKTTNRSKCLDSSQTLGQAHNMRLIKYAFWILGVTIVWYIVHEIEYCLNLTLGEFVGEITSPFFESAVYAFVSLLVSMLHYGAIFWILFALWWRVQHSSSKSIDEPVN